MPNLAWTDTIRAKLTSTANNNMRLPRRAPLVLSTTTRARNFLGEYWAKLWSTTSEDMRLLRQVLLGQNY